MVNKQKKIEIDINQLLGVESLFEKIRLISDSDLVELSLN